ncbi:MAG: CCA tRNA nucleotidyltransferase [Acutalibacteraceae bacterium]
MSENILKGKELIKILNNNGFEAYFVGGCVRDLLMKKTPDDFDITTNAKPDEMKIAFSEYKTVETGIAHGTVTVINKGTSFEITAFRRESTYSDNRHPDSVTFTPRLEDDLSRRDFTVNSLAMDIHGNLTDLFGGIKDIENKIIRTVGNPDERFKEDALRILRALRFSSCLDFEIENKTKKALHKNKELLKNISAERIYSEFVKLLCGKNVKNVITEFYDIIGVFIPQINKTAGFNQQNIHHIYDILTHTAVVTESIKPLPHLRLAAFFHDIGKPFCFSVGNDGQGHFYSHPKKSAEITDETLKNLRCDNKTRETVVALVKAHDTPIEETEKFIKRRLNVLGETLFFDLILLQRADTMGLAPKYQSRKDHFQKLEKIARQILSEKQCFSLKDLSVNGNDLITLGLKGKEIGDTLKSLLEAVIDGKVENEKLKLIEYAELIKQ